MGCVASNGSNGQGKRIFELPVQWTDDVSSSKVKIWPLAKRYIAAMKALNKKRPK